MYKDFINSTHKRTNMAMTIPKSKRLLSEVKVDNCIGPTSYNVKVAAIHQEYKG